MNPIAATLAGIVMAAALWWQNILWEKWKSRNLSWNWNENKEKIESYKVRRRQGELAFQTGLLLPVVLSAVIALGIMTIATTALLDTQNTQFNFRSFSEYFIKALTLLAITALKAYISIVVAGYVIASEIYFWFTYGEFRPVPLLTALFDWIFNFGPNWVGSLWLGSQVIWSVVTGSIFTALSHKP